MATRTIRRFETWDTDSVELTFGLRQLRSMPLLNEWITAKQKPLSAVQAEFLTQVQQSLLQNANGWNEDELKLHFIGPLLVLVNFDQEHYKGFSQRRLKANIGAASGASTTVTVAGDVDFVVATGKVNPREPFFFLHEYRRERGRDNDPIGQLLIEMLTAQELNAVKHPLYGCYVLGRNWFFVVLNDKYYAVSNAFNATDNDLFQIVAILTEMKNIIEQFLDVAEVHQA